MTLIEKVVPVILRDINQRTEILGSVDIYCAKK